jgi:phosphate transport system ATP-binding protein
VDERGIQMVATVVNVQVKNEEKIETAPKKVVFDTKNLNLWYGEDHALKDINLSIHENEVTAIIGPSGCGKSTY